MPFDEPLLFFVLLMPFGELPLFFVPQELSGALFIPPVVEPLPS